MTYTGVCTSFVECMSDIAFLLMKKRLIFGSCADVKAVRLLSSNEKRPEKTLCLHSTKDVHRHTLDK